MVEKRENFGGYSERIKHLQRSELDEQGMRIPEHEVAEAVARAVDLSTTLPVWMVKVTGISRIEPDKRPGEAEINYYTKDILAGLNGQGIPIYFFIHGKPRRIDIYVGTLSELEGAAQSVRSLFNSQYHGCRLWPGKDRDDATVKLEAEAQLRLNEAWQEAKRNLQDIRLFLKTSPHIGIITGIPTPATSERGSQGTQLDRFIRGLYGSEWAYLVLAEPLEEESIINHQLGILEEQLRLEQEENIRGWQESSTRTSAMYYHQLLQMRHQFLEKCLYEGGWQVQSYICSPDNATYMRAKALIKSIFSGDFSRLDRIRILDCPGAGLKAASFSPIICKRPYRDSPQRLIQNKRELKYHTDISSSQLSALIHLPRIEIPGYFVQESAPFDVSSHLPAGEKTIAVGEILDRGQPTGNPYHVRVQDLDKHCLLVGITGSGKTNTMFHLLGQLERQEQAIPFLVIEPAKREYRQLKKLLDPGSDLRIFTVGEETESSAPIRFNPFEIRRGVPVQTHIDLLKSVFNASFAMWAPLPQVLERALHEIYRDKGWNTVYNINERATAGDSKEAAWHPDAQPTLSDLLFKIAEMVPRLGYEKEVTRNIKTALETRINSLRVGAKGMMLDTPSSIPIETLLDKPTILELEGVGDDDEKAFIMGLFLIMLYEHYRLKGSPEDVGLQHITVIEEAHRLLANVSPHADQESSNPRGKAVETFVNMLSEIRAYGEGFFIAEQIPTKLAPDVIKNTALKVMHRLVSYDDRKVMGGAMNLNDRQTRQVVSLGTGEAVVHGGGHYCDDNAILARVPYSKGRKESHISAPEIRQVWEDFRDQNGLGHIFQSYRTCGALCQPLNLRCTDARKISEAEALTEAMAAFVSTLAAESLTLDDSELVHLASRQHQKLIEAIRASISGPGEDRLQFRCIVTHALYRYMEHFGQKNDWQYRDVEYLCALVLPGLTALTVNTPLTGERVNQMVLFCQNYAALCRKDFDPFSGCARVCPGDPEGGRLCLFRYHVEPYLFDHRFKKVYEETRQDPKELAELARDYANRIVNIEPAGPLFPAAALCFPIQAINGDQTLSNSARRILTDQTIDYFLSNKESLLGMAENQSI